MKRNLIFNKTVLAVIILNIAQVVLITGLMIFEFFKDAAIFIEFDSITISFVLIILISFINAFINIRDIYRLGHINSSNDMLQQTLSQLEDLNKNLRAQRHDFMNHLQVVYSLIELEEYKETKDYIEKVYGDIQKVSRVMRTSNPGINALLQAKILACEKRGIVPLLNINTQLNGIKIPTWEFCRVLGNVIDNAIYALENSSGDKKLRIDLFEDIKAYCFRIEDNGPGIPDEIIDKIFTAGFTTKGDKGEGMGLSIVREILQKYGGSIKVSSSGTNTVFEGIVPK